MASDIFNALEQRELPNGPLIVAGCRFENKERVRGSDSRSGETASIRVEKTTASEAPEALSGLVIRRRTIEALLRCRFVAEIAFRNRHSRAVGATLAGSGGTPQAIPLPKCRTIRHNSPMTPLLSGDCEGSDRIRRNN
jgi:hypothetical protein